MDEREYRLPEWRVQFSQACFCALCGLPVLALVAGEASLFLWAIYVPFGCSTLWVAFAKFPRMRVTETRDGLLTFSALTSAKRILPWDTIERFEPVPGTRGRVVAAVGKTGRRTAVVGLDAGDEMFWVEDGDEFCSEDLIAELNHRLKLWRSLACRSPSDG